MIPTTQPVVINFNYGAVSLTAGSQYTINFPSPSTISMNASVTTYAGGQASYNGNFIQTFLFNTVMYTSIAQVTSAIPSFMLNSSSNQLALQPNNSSNKLNLTCNVTSSSTINIPCPVSTDTFALLGLNQTLTIKLLLILQIMYLLII